MKENKRMLQRLLACKPACCNPKELKKRPKKLAKLNDIASTHPLKTTCFERSKRQKSVTTLKRNFHVLEVLSD